eukprot:COSAG01_NODE_48543_length_380_cov_0.846975_1_plen_32_part_10
MVHAREVHYIDYMYSARDPLRVHHRRARRRGR